MGCGSCSSGGCSPTGCGDKGHCASGGCNRLNVTDWLSNLELPWGQKANQYVEVRFKGNRKDFFVNSNQLDLLQNEWVVVEAQHGHDLGQVTLKGELVRLQMKRKRVAEDDHSIRKIYRKATEQDMQKLTELREQEAQVSYRAREIIKSCKLNMKLTDVEHQADRSKIIFYYTAEERVDFRELIRLLAENFKVRVEMKQIGARQEAARIGGLGVCGRELCCSSWLTDFKAVSTSAARYQNLSLNPVKLAGQCGRLKCCLNYELDTYMDALQAFPKDAKLLQTETATYELVKTDIFKRLMWYQLQGRPGEYVEANAFPLSIEKAVEIKAMNKDGVKPESIEGMAVQLEVLTEEEVEPEFEWQAEGVLDRFDGSGGRGKNKRKKKPGRGGDRPQGVRQPNKEGGDRPQGGKQLNIAGADRPKRENSGDLPVHKEGEAPAVTVPTAANRGDRTANPNRNKRRPQDGRGRRSEPGAADASADKPTASGDTPAGERSEGQQRRSRNNRRRPPRKPGSDTPSAS